MACVGHLTASSLRRLAMSVAGNVMSSYGIRQICKKYSARFDAQVGIDQAREN